MSHVVDSNTTNYYASKARYIMVFENHRKSLIQQCERSELRLHFEWTKVTLKCPPKGPFWRVKLENLINIGHL